MSTLHRRQYERVGVVQEIVELVVHVQILDEGLVHRDGKEIPCEKKRKHIFNGLLPPITVDYRFFISAPAITGDETRIFDFLIVGICSPMADRIKSFLLSPAISPDVTRTVVRP